MGEKPKLVVIGNGMAGARTVEEILARGGGDQFEITMFGEDSQETTTVSSCRTC
jgi:nitrite reductase (NADH) large subunit